MFFSHFKTVPYDMNGDGVYDEIVNLTNSVRITEKLADDVSLYEYIVVTDGQRPDQLSYALYGNTKYYWTFLLTNPWLRNFWNDWPKDDSQLLDYSLTRHYGVAAMTNDSLSNKFTLGETVRGILSNATGIINEIYVNNGYINIDVTSGTFRESGEDILGLSSQDAVTATSVRNYAYSPKYHVDDATLQVVPKRLAGTTPKTHLDLDTADNARHQRLKVIKPQHIEAIYEEFLQEING